MHGKRNSCRIEQIQIQLSFLLIEKKITVLTVKANSEILLLYTNEQFYFSGSGQ